ncbi:MAG: MFS transporter [Deltaproteobacteria bacterium]|nr:MFS transporter [Deltaproteobacteria bacterium]
MVRFRETVALIRHNRFGLLFISDAISNIGDWLSLIALMILSYEETASPMGVSGILIARAIPTLFLGIYAGAVADRVSRKKIVIISNFLRGITILPLVFTRDPLVLYPVAFMVAALGSFFNPSIEASLPGLVGEKRITRANSWLNGGKTIAMILGPALAAISIQYLGIHTTFLLDAISFVFFAILLLFVPITSKTALQEYERRGVLEEIKEGFQFIGLNKIILKILLSYGVAFCAMGALGTLELVFCSEILKVDTHIYGKIVAIAGVGALAGSIVCAGVVKEKVMRLYILGIILFGLGIFLFSFQTVLLATIPFLLMEGVGESFFSICGRSYLQHETPNAMLGKTMGIRDLMEKFGMLSGMFLAGILATYIDVKLILMGFGILLILSNMGMILNGFWKRA